MSFKAQDPLPGTKFGPHKEKIEIAIDRNQGVCPCSHGIFAVKEDLRCPCETYRGTLECQCSLYIPE
jgi:hypothetical protein